MEKDFGLRNYYYAKLSFEVNEIVNLANIFATQKQHGFDRGINFQCKGHTAVLLFIKK